MKYKKKCLTEYDIAAMIGWYRMCGNFETVGLLAGVSTIYAKVVVETYLENKKPE